jgi:hypothetical protein
VGRIVMRSAALRTQLRIYIRLAAKTGEKSFHKFIHDGYWGNPSSDQERRSCDILKF